MAGYTKVLNSGDPATDLTGTAYRMLLVDSAGDVVELAHGAANKVLTSGGASANPSWEDTQAAATLDSIGDVAAITEAQGQVIFRSAAAWDALDPGTSGHFLKTQGASSDPVWAAVSVAAIDDITDVVITTVGDDDILAFDTTASGWINQTAAEAGLAATPHDLGGSDHNTATLAELNAKISDATLDTSTATRTPTDNSVGNSQMDNTATDIAVAQLIFTPAANGTGTTEGTVYYDSDDNHLYVYVV